MPEQGRNYLRYRDEISGLDLSMSPHAVGLLSQVMGFDVSGPASDEQIYRSQRWIHGSSKRIFEKSLCQLFGYLGGRAMTKLAEKGIQRHDGLEGLVAIDVGFLGSDGPIMCPEIKIRTMVHKAAGLRESPFQHTSFLAGKGSDDPRVLSSRLAKILRRTALDELPQPTYQVPAGELAVVGARGYTEPELTGTAILIESAQNSRVELSDRARDLLDTYRAKVDRYSPTPSMMGLLQATTSKETPHLMRMYGDVVYWERATPLVDFRIVLYTVKQRALGVGAW
ncbi:hypothetical protein A3F34_02025 [Candidatus Roizmanbacteria bacterium RIFCSPHIGHO2_12_FULL_44_10]|uniref:Bacterial sugar transferase domain-containing protein n=1 Tax=Candidatus Roizmanbacteria bacterium RIFCSPHIGHO2_12_FULL_44_10 TaxID=1802054 RepID=A0A1F7I6B3_9BACT|nr:MAG: hypothetical protein A3F34_02025 [Candidatus Roizmanbacteria bacterium RIFCSPHIGHO2_12_FULL_44_10]